MDCLFEGGKEEIKKDKEKGTGSGKIDSREKGNWDNKQRLPTGTDIFCSEEGEKIKLLGFRAKF